MEKLPFLLITVSQAHGRVNYLELAAHTINLFADNTVFVNTTTPPGNRRHWFSYALNDPALFHTTLFISASHITAMRKVAILPAFFKHRGEVIRIVNDRLRKDEAAAATDGTIGAVAGLMVTDVR